MAVKGRRTANSQGRRKGRITRSMTSEVEETAAPPVNNELGWLKELLLFSSESQVAFWPTVLRKFEFAFKIWPDS